MSFAFKKFNFFQQVDLRDPSTGDARNGTCYAASSSHLYVGCDSGIVQALNERAQLAFSFVAHGSRVFHATWIAVRSWDRSSVEEHLLNGDLFCMKCRRGTFC